MILRLRTNDNLLQLLENGESPAWKLSQSNFEECDSVEIFNFPGTLRLTAAIAHNRSWVADENDQYEPGRIIVAFNNARIETAEFEWSGRNPVAYA